MIIGAVLALAFILPSLAADKPAPEVAGKKKSDSYDEKFMRRAIEISRTAIDTPGAEPFGAVIVKNGEIVGEGLSHALLAWDVTSHGEIEAIRDANRRLERLDLSDCEIYTTCEPCPMCVSVIGVARLGKMYYGAKHKQAEEAFSVLPPNSRLSVNIKKLVAEQQRPVDQRQLPAEQKLAAESFEILKAWALERKAALSK